MIWLSEAETPGPAPTTPTTSATATPPCWCGDAIADHPQAADHPYTPAGGIEAEAHDAW
jgi:hypothetical protein